MVQKGLVEITKNMMENLNKMFSELTKSEIIKTDFISNISHELKTPLSIIKLLSDSLIQT